MLDIAAVESDQDAFAAGLAERLRTHAGALGHPFGTATLAFEARWRGERIGGVYAELPFEWVLVKYLAVADGHRGRGVGSALLGALEAAGAARGAIGVFLDTYGFEAPGFYPRLGYEEIGRLPAPDPARTRVLFTKLLAPTPG
jgi:GNAT superfamily N-acetyltransferase